MKNLKSFIVGTSLIFCSLNSHASDGQSWSIPEFKNKWETQTKKAHSKPNTKRKLASNMTFSENDLSADFKKLREEWLKVKNAEQMEQLLNSSYAKYDSYSDDTKYFLAQIHLAMPLRGIVWRIRPLFEKGTKFIGNKSTHVMAVQMVRSFANNLDMFLPTDQSDAAFKFFTEPSAEMTSKQQFKQISDFQNFLAVEYAKKIAESSAKIDAILNKNPSAIFVWDNKMQFGTGAFRDGIERYTGYGAAEMNLALAGQYRALHSIFVFSAYNQNQAIDVAGKIGSHFGQDSMGWWGKDKEDLGMTDEERVQIIKNAINKNGFLTLRDFPNNPYGTNLMKRAYDALSNSTFYAEEAYNILQGKDANTAMALNPILYSASAQDQIDRGVKNMVAVVKGPAEVRDPVSGKSVTLNLPAFYNNPPKNLSSLMAVKFDMSPGEVVIKNKNGEELKTRNYDSGKSIGWNNDAWKNFVPSAEGKDDSYMSEARRIIRYSLGSNISMSLPTIFVR